MIDAKLASKPMVVPTATAFSRALLEPLRVIEELHDTSKDTSTFVNDVQRHFDGLFAAEDAYNKIPLLTRSSLGDQLRSSVSLGQPRLVRWTCMIQDTSLGNEVVPRHLTTDDGTLRNGLFGAALTLSDAESSHVSATQQLCGVATLYGVTVPAQTAWAMEKDGAGDDIEHFTSTTEDADYSIREADLFLTDKLPRGEPMGALLKIYNEDLAEKLRVRQVVDVIGVLDKSITPSAEWSSTHDEGDVSSARSLLTMHVVSLAPHAERIGETDYPAASDVELLRRGIIDLLASTVNGDNLVARYIFLAIIARIHTRSLAKTLGHLSLNIWNMPLPPSANSTPKLLKLLQSLLETVAEQSLALAHLNDGKVAFAPRNAADDASLRAGCLQLVDGTLLFVDEGSMEEGQLQEHGMSNIRDISTLLASQKLLYHYPYSDIQMDIDLPCIVISQGRSFLPVGAHVRLDACQAKDVYGPWQPESAVSEKLPLFRRYLQSMQRLAASPRGYSIPNDVSSRIQDDFVQSRKGQNNVEAAQSVSDAQELFSQSLEIARLLCISRGGESLAWEDWLEAKEMQQYRAQRKDEPRA